MGVRIVDGRRRLLVERSFLDVADHSDDLAERILAVHERVDLLPERLLARQVSAHEGLVDDEAVGRTLDRCRRREIAAALQRNSHRPEVSGHDGADGADQLLARPRRRASGDADPRSRGDPIERQIADRAGRLARRASCSMRSMARAKNRVRLGILGIFAAGNRNAERQHIRGVETRIDGLQTDKAAEQQHAADEQHHRERHLGADQPGAQPARAADVRTSAVAQTGRQPAARAGERRRDAEEHSR